MDSQELLIRKTGKLCFVLDDGGNDVTVRFAGDALEFKELDISSFTLRAIGYDGHLHPTDCLELEGESLSDISQEERVGLFVASLPQEVNSDSPIQGRAGEETTDLDESEQESEICVEIIGVTRKPDPWGSGEEPKEDLAGERALKAFRKLQQDSKTYYYRCAIHSDGKLVPIESEHELALGDLTLKWGAEHEEGVWKGTDDPQIWQMAEGFEHRQQGDWAYGNTHAVKLEPVPKLGDIITAVPILMRSWKDAKGAAHYSWTFPRVKEFDPTRKKPDTTADADKIVQASPKSLRKARGPRPFGHPGGKTLLLKYILPLIPAHDTYCEPMVGSGTVFFAKPKARKSILSDIDPELIFALKFVRDITAADIEWLRKQSWQSSKGRWQFLFKQKPVRKREKFYRFLYLNYNSWADTPKKGYAGGKSGSSRSVEPSRLQAASQMLKGNVSILQRDAYKVMREHDAPSTFFYIDPPYPGSGDLKAFEGKAPEPKELARFLKSLSGKWLLSFSDTKESREAFKSFKIKRVTLGRRYTTYSPKTKTGQAMRTRTELLVANYDLKKVIGLEEVKQIPEGGQEFSEDKGEIHLEKSVSFSTKIFHSPKDGRTFYLYGPFLVPGKKLDKQNHRVSAEEILKAIRWIEDLGFDIEHTEDVPEGSLKLTQIFQSPGNFRVNGKVFKKGTGIIEIEVNSSDIKKRVLAGELNGFSIEGRSQIDQDGYLHNIRIQKITLAGLPAIEEEFVIKSE